MQHDLLFASTEATTITADSEGSPNIHKGTRGSLDKSRQEEMAAPVKDQMVTGGDLVSKASLQGHKGTIGARATCSDDPQGSMAARHSSAKLPWQHMIDVATRLSQAAIIKDKTEESILASATQIWFNPYGPPRILETDQESGLICHEAKTYCQVMGTQAQPRSYG